MTAPSVRTSAASTLAWLPATIGLGLAEVLAAVLPWPWMLALGRAGSRAMFALLPGVRAALLDNARHILGDASAPPERAALARGVLASFARFAIELIAARRRMPGGEALLERTHGRESYERAARRGRGIIWITLHMGNYEIGPMLLAREFQPVAIIYRRDPIGLFERLRSRQRRGCRLQEIDVERTPFFGVEALSVLRRKGMVLLAGDVGFESDEGDERPFLGGRARFPRIGARLALASGTPLLPCFIVRDAAGRYRHEIGEPIFPDEARDVEAIMQRLIAAFERAVRTWPDQWLIIHRYWTG